MPERSRRSAPLHRRFAARSARRQKFVAAGCGNQQTGGPRYPELRTAVSAAFRLAPRECVPGEPPGTTGGPPVPPTEGSVPLSPPPSGSLRENVSPASRRRLQAGRLFHPPKAPRRCLRRLSVRSARWVSAGERRFRWGVQSCRAKCNLLSRGTVQNARFLQRAAGSPCVVSCYRLDSYKYIETWWHGGS